MRYVATLWGMVAVMALIVPAEQSFGFSENSQEFRPRSASRKTVAQGAMASDRKAEADQLLQQGLQQSGASQFREASQSWERALEIYREIGDQAGEVASLNYLGIAYNSLGQHEQAIDFLQKSLVIAQEINYRQAKAASLSNLGNAYHSLGQYQQAIDFYKQSLAIAREIGDRNGESINLENLGMAYDSLGQYQQAIDIYEQSLAIAREIGDLASEAKALGNLGIAHNKLGNYSEAISLTEQVLEIFRGIGNRVGEINALINLSGFYNDASNYSQAISLGNEGLIASQGIDASHLEASALGNLGNAHFNVGNYQQAMSYYQQGLIITREIGDRSGEGMILRNLSALHRNLGDYQMAIDLSENALSIAREISDRAAEGSALGNLGIAYGSQGAYLQAINYFEQHLTIAREVGDPIGEGVALSNLGSAYASLGQYQRAINFHEKALKITQDIGNRAGEGSVLGNLGSTYESLGQYQRAIDFYEQSLVIAREIGALKKIVINLNGLGSVYNSLGDYQKAIDFTKLSLAIAHEMSDREGEGAALGNLGLIAFNQANFQQAIEFYEQSLNISRRIGDPNGEANVLNNLGEAYRNLGDYQQAISLYEESLATSRRIGDRAEEGRGLGNLGIVYRQLKNYETAINYYEQQLALVREIEDLPGQSISLHNLGELLVYQGQFTQAELLLSQSIEVFENFRTNLPDHQLISIADVQRSTYQLLEQALITQGKNKQALTVSERGRARAFVLQLSNRLSTLEEQVNIEHSPAAEAPSIAEIQQIARDSNTTLVTYSQIFDQALYIWVVHPSGDIQFRSVEFDGSGESGFAVNPIASIDGPLYRSAPDDSELTTLVSDLRATINVEVTNDLTNPEKLKELHQILIDPIADLLPSDPEAKVVFIPQGSLFLVPFAALQDENGTHLIEKHTILTAPSIQVFGLANQGVGNREQGAGQALVVGNPVMPKVWQPTTSGEFAETQLSDLPGAKAEAEAIGSFLKIPTLTGEQATEARVKQQLPSAQLIHLATHGLLDYGDPQSYGTLDVPGAIALAPGSGEDGLLTSAEILEMDLQADLAVLSACDTGRGRITGDGVVGLSRSLITAGVPSVVVSLWAVPDSPTAELMTEFYRQLDQGLDKAQALRQAMLITMEKHPNPRDWAAFTLIGAAK